VNTWRTMQRRLVDVALAQGAELAGPLSSTPAGAAALRSGIQYEAFLRQQQRCSMTALSMATGIRTQHQRWAHLEAAERARLAPDRAARGPGTPHVFWHGPDRQTDAARQLVVFVNGWTVSGLVWPKDVVSHIGQTCDVVRIDNRGTGYSRTAPAPFTIATMADDVAAVVRAFGARSATIVGLSMGGMIAQELALRHPHLVDRLVLCGTRPPAPVGFVAADAVIEATMTPPRAGESLSEYLARSWRGVLGPGFAERRPEAFVELIDQIGQRPTPHAAVMTQLRAIAAWHGAHRLARISAPTTVIHGTDDPLIPVGNGMRLAQMIPGATYIELPGIGHVVPFEAPDVLIAQLTTA